MDLVLHDHVIVLDEAHNIEDSAREAASCKLTQSSIAEARDELQKLKEMNFNTEECNELVSL